MFSNAFTYAAEWSFFFFHVSTTAVKVKFDISLIVKEKIPKNTELLLRQGENLLFFFTNEWK